MEGTTTTPWTYTGNLLNKGKGSVDDSVDGYLPLSMSADSCHTSLLYYSWKLFINRGPNSTICMTYCKPPAERSTSSPSLFYCLRREESLPSFMLQAHKLGRQPCGELSLKEFLLLFGSGPGCLHSAAGEAPYCLDKLPNTQNWRLSNYPPVKMCLCHHCFVHSSFNTIRNFNKVVLSLTKHLQVSEAAVQMTLLLFI